MHGELARPWTVATLAREAGMSRSSFAATFKAVTGETPLDYLTSWRMYRAKRLLRETELGLMEIATRVGYKADAALTTWRLKKVEARSGNSQAPRPVEGR